MAISADGLNKVALISENLHPYSNPLKELLQYPYSNPLKEPLRYPLVVGGSGVLSRPEGSLGVGASRVSGLGRCRCQPTFAKVFPEPRTLNPKPQTLNPLNHSGLSQIRLQGPVYEIHTRLPGCSLGPSGPLYGP